MPASERQPNRPVTEAATLTERAAMLVEQDILAGHLAPGSRLGIVDLVQRCQYRLDQDGTEATFHENDVFLGGVFYFYTKADLDELGWTRQQGIEDLKLIQTRVWLARRLPDGSTGQLIEQNLRQHGTRTFTLCAIDPLLPARCGC